MDKGVTIIIYTYDGQINISDLSLLEEARNLYSGAKMEEDSYISNFFN